MYELTVRGRAVELVCWAAGGMACLLLIGVLVGAWVALMFLFPLPSDPGHRAVSAEAVELA